MTTHFGAPFVDILNPGCFQLENPSFWGQVAFLPHPLGHLFHPRTPAAAITLLLNSGTFMLQRVTAQSSPVLQIITTVRFPCIVEKKTVVAYENHIRLKALGQQCHIDLNVDPGSVTHLLQGLRPSYCTCLMELSLGCLITKTG